MSLPPGPRWPALFQTISLMRSGQAFIERAAARYGDLFTVRTLVFGTQVLGQRGPLKRGRGDLTGAGDGRTIPACLLP